jgi:hypothetical protein
LAFETRGCVLGKFIDMTGQRLGRLTVLNRKVNLRVVNASQNAMNYKVSSNNKSGTRGVIYDTKSKKWRAEIKINGKHISLGRYDKLEDAVAARKAAEEKYFGEYSYDNSRKDA